MIKNKDIPMLHDGSEITDENLTTVDKELLLSIVYDYFAELENLSSFSGFFDIDSIVSGHVESGKWAYDSMTVDDECVKLALMASVFFPNRTIEVESKLEGAGYTANIEAWW